MARLPDATALGAAPSAASGRQISSIDGSAIGQGMQVAASGMRQLAAGQQAQARGYQAMGEGIAEGFQQVAKVYGQDDELANSQRLADFMNEKIALDGERDREPDPAKLEGYVQRYQGLVQKYAGQFPDQRSRQRFMIKVGDDVTRSTQGTLGIIQQKKNEQELGSAVQSVEAARKSYLEAKDPEARKLIEDGVTGTLNGLAQKGIITPQRAAEARQKWVKGAYKDALELMQPEQRLAAVDGSKGLLRMRESGGDPTRENQLGFAGLYQFGAPRLQTLGVYTPGANEDMQGWNQSSKTAPGKWSGTFNIPGFPNVRTKADFLSNAAAQEAVYQLDDAKKSQELKANGLDKYIGQTIGGVKITEEGIKNMIHLGGAGGASAFLTSGGVIDRADKNGTKLSDYARMGEAGKGSPVSQVLDPLEIKQIRDQAEAQLQQKARIAEQEDRATALQLQAERKARVNALEVGILDDKLGAADVVRARESGDLTDAGDIKRVMGMVEEQQKRVDRRATMQGFLDGSVPYNPYNPEHVKAADEFIDFAAKARGIPKEQAALMAYDATGALTKTGVTALRGALYRNDTDSIKAVGTIAANMMFRPTKQFPNGNQRVFDGHDGGKELEEVGLAFNHYTRDLQLDPEEAAKRIAETRSPEYQKTLKIDDKAADDFEKQLKKTAINDLAKGEFPGSGVFFNNTLGNPGMREDMASTYASEAAYFYRKHGDPDRAKSEAMAEVKKVYGVSNGVLMKFPPENVYPAMPVSGSKDYIYRQAADDIKLATGQTVDPKNIWFQDTAGTADEFRAKVPTGYQVLYVTEKNGIKTINTLATPKGTRWKADPKAEAEKELREQRMKAENEWNQTQREMRPSGVVTVEDTKPTGLAGRVRPMEERQAEAQAKTEFRQQRMQDVAKAAPKNADRQKARDEALAKNTDRSIVDAARDWIASTPPLKDAMPKIQLRPQRNVLPGGEK